MPNLVGLDFETYSAVDLPKHGLARYIASPTFIPLIGSVAKPSRSTNRSTYTQTVTFINDIGAGRQQLEDLIGDATIVAHNAAFEKAVLKRMGLIYPSSRFLDSAVIARIAGGGGRLEAAGPQLLGVDKLEAGRNLMRLFSIPPKDAEPGREFDPQVIQDNLDEWLEYIHYCEVDAELSLTLARDYQHVMGPREQEYAAATMDMNEVGWRVDVPLVREMQRRYLDNQERVLQQFRDQHGADELNLNSLKQLKEWCADRGIKATQLQ